jgi:hypothetical protein
MMDCVPHLEVSCPQERQEAAGVFAWLLTYLGQINVDLHRHQEADRGSKYNSYQYNKSVVFIDGLQPMSVIEHNGMERIKINFT